MQGILVDYRFVVFAQVLMKVLMHILIYVLKIFNCRISFKLLFSMCLGILENELLTQLWSSNFPNSTFEKITITVAEDALILVFFPNVGFKQNNNKKHTEYHGIFTPFKSQIYSKHGSSTFLLFGSCSLVWYIHVSIKATFSVITPTWQT